MAHDSLAEAEGYLQTPGEVDGAVEGLQRLHAVLPLAPGDVAELEDRRQRRSTLKVVVAQLQRLIASALKCH